METSLRIKSWLGACLAWGRRWRFWHRTALETEPVNLHHGRLGEDAACRYLRQLGLKLLARNFAGRHGEIDLVFRDTECLVFVEVKARGMASWTRPANAVNQAKRRRLSRTALAYLRQARKPRVAIRFDVVEVLLLDGQVHELRHLPNTFSLSHPYRYG
jgi:putative endonuclease